MDANSPGQLRKNMGYSFDDGSLAIPHSSLGGDFSSLPAPDHHGHFGSTEKAPVTVIQSGLKFSLASSKQLSLAVTYASLPGVEPMPKDWIICCPPDNNIYREHVSYIKVADTKESLCSVVENCAVILQGLIIINSSSSIKLPNEFIRDGIPKDMPVYVVSLEDGERLDEFISKQEAGDVQLKVVVEPDKTTGLSPSKNSQSKVKCYNVNEEVKKLLIVGKNDRTHVSNDVGKFQCLISSFHNYELQPKRELLDKAVRLLDSVNDEMFKKDFLFYLLLAYRFITYEKTYNVTDAAFNYAHNCITRFEEVDMDNIADVMHAFVNGGDFSVQWYHCDRSVFDLLHHMAIVMLRKSIALKKSVQKFAVYERILWISLSWFFGLLTDLQIGTLSPIWRSGLLLEKEIEFSDDTVRDFSRGFQLFDHLKLPKVALFDITTFAVFLNPKQCNGIHFLHIKKLLELGVKLFSWDAKFLCEFLPPLRNNYKFLFDNATTLVKWNKYSSDGTKLSLYKEGNPLARSSNKSHIAKLFRSREVIHGRNTCTISELIIQHTAFK